MIALLVLQAGTLYLLDSQSKTGFLSELDIYFVVVLARLSFPSKVARRESGRIYKYISISISIYKYMYR